MDYLLNYEAMEGILRRDYLRKDSIGFQEAQSIFQRSNVILDIPCDDQAGFTHRFVLALAQGKKCITTNKAVIYEDFFNPDQIHLIDPVNPILDSEWINETKKYSVDSSFNELELSEWLNNLIDFSAS
jgi:hypothetical protein